MSEQASQDPPEASAGGALEETPRERLHSNVKTILGAVLLAIFIRIVLFEAFEIDGPSMEPTLLHGDRVVVAKCLFGLSLPGMNEAVLTWGAPNPGDVVIAISPADDVAIVKRVIGVPGDTIEVRDHQIYRNGKPIPTRPSGECAENSQRSPETDCTTFEERLGDHVYHVHRSSNPYDPEPDQAPILIPEGHVFVLGDHRNQSNDSRNPMVGPIPIARLKGRALFIYLSSSAAGFRADRIGQGID
jgi:signal peptidase I